MSAFISVLTINIFLPEAHTLKEKRHTVKSIIEKIKANTNSSVAETDFHDLWQRSQITVALVQKEKAFLEKQINIIEKIVNNYPEAQVNDFIVDDL